MKIVFLKQGSFLENIGGAERALANCANLLFDLGHDVICVGAQPVFLENIYELKKGIKINNLNTAGQEFKGTLLHKFLRELTQPLLKKGIVTDYYEQDVLKETAQSLQQLLNREHPDLLVAFSKKDAAILKYVRLPKGKTAVMLHGGERDIRDIFEPQNKHIYEGLKRADCCLVLLPYQKKLLQVRLPGKKIHIIPNIIDVVQGKAGEKESYSREEMPASVDFGAAQASNSKNIVMLARMIPSKRPDLLIKAFALAQSQEVKSAPLTKWTVHLYGRFLKADFDWKIKTLIRKLNLEEKVFLKGETNIPAQVLARTDIFVFPSAEEGFGLALAEAMAAGVPCLAAADCRAAVCLLEEGECGLLRDPNPESFAQGLRLLMERAELRQDLGERGKKAVCKYGREKLKIKWEQILQNEDNDSSL